MKTLEEIREILNFELPCKAIKSETYEGGFDYYYLQSDVEKAMNAFANRSKWISVEDELPKEREWIIISSEKYGELSCGYKSSMWNLAKPTHWQPLPEPPKL